MKNFFLLSFGIALFLGPTLAASCADTSFRVPFSIEIPVLTSEVQTGFDSGLVAAGRLPDAYARGSSRSFPFTWKNLPAGTKALALMLDDPDAKPVLAAMGSSEVTFRHWLATDIDPTTGGLADDDSVNGSLIQGSNDVGRVGYFGPNPRAGVKVVHVYRLMVWALSATTDLDTGFSQADLDEAMAGKILGQAQVIASFNNR